MFYLKISNKVELYRLRFDRLNNEQIFATKDTWKEKQILGEIYYYYYY
jgi:hypothetical protein